ncbi:heme ABC exporter ATP-binding protein CcmA [Hartmannibacter diazotrophicus]|nr:heme ABC exporter ATP-binding protein CcmA [Hartmannibacter diazotrophicus]
MTPSAEPHSSDPEGLVLDGICVLRGGRRVLHGVNVRLAPKGREGAALFITGPNGVGKSTLLRAIAGLTSIEAGQLSLDLSGDKLAGTDVGEGCHYLGHRDAIKTALTVTENLAFWQSFLGEPRTGEGRGHPLLSIDDALEAVDLLHLADLPSMLLSAGQRRRLSIARLLVAARPVWLMDEPTSALDKASEARLVDLMRAHVTGGGLILAATHLAIDLENAQELALERVVYDPLEELG